MCDNKSLDVFYKNMNCAYNMINNLGTTTKKLNRWIYDSLYIFYRIKAKDEKAQYILDFYEKKIEMRKKTREKHFFDRLQEIYEYYTKNNMMPIHDMDAYFSDGKSMKSWIKNNMSKLEQLSDTNQIAKLIIDYNKTNPQQKELNIYKKIDELYVYFNSEESKQQIDENAEFSDGSNIINWLDKNITKLFETNDTDLRIAVIINFYMNTKNKNILLDKDTIKKISEIYIYVLKNKVLPDYNSKDKFSDGSNIRIWLDSNLELLNSIKGSNLYANTIITAYNSDVKKQRSIKLNKSKIDELYNICESDGISYIIKNKLKFSDGTDMSAWIKKNIKTLEALKEKDYKASKILEELNKYNDFNKKILKIASFKNSLEFNKKVLELYKYCILERRLPNKSDNCKLHNGCNMVAWLNNNKVKIWKTRFRNPYCLKLVKEILKINGAFFKKVANTVDYEIMDNRVSVKKMKILINHINL